MKEEEIFTHPSFGQIEVSRTTGGGQKFYGSELPQDHYITIRVHESEVKRTLTQDWYYPRKTILQLRLTSNQFAEMITNMNYGTGVTCTLEHVMCEKREQIPLIEDRKSFVHRKFEERMREFAVTLKEKQALVKSLSDKKTLSKDDQQKLNWAMDWITQEVTGNIPFFAKCFQETMDKVVVEAKTEVENAIMQKVTTLGLEALHKENKLINP